MPAPARSGRRLVVDDEVELVTALCESPRDGGYDADGHSDPAAGLAALRGGAFDVLLSDLMMPGTDGIQPLRRGLAADPDLVGIIMTGRGSIQTAAEAMKAGAFDSVLKPFRLQQVLPVLDRATEVRRLRRVVKALTFESPRYHLAGASPALREVLGLIEKVAPTDAAVPVRGPSGAGKELVARAIHGNSPRRDKPLVTVNCATLQEALLESELFGRARVVHRRRPGEAGAVRGRRGRDAVHRRGGRDVAGAAGEAAAGAGGRARPAGGEHAGAAGGRAGGGGDEQAAGGRADGRFREDLFFRLNVITVTPPALRERAEDVPPLVTHFLTTRAVGGVPMRIEPEAVAVLARYDWPGNARELANVIERAQILAEGHTITTDDLADNVVRAASAASPAAPDDPDSLDAVECRHAAEVPRRAGGNKGRAAKALGVSRRTLYRMIERYGPADVDRAPAGGGE